MHMNVFESEESGIIVRREEGSVFQRTLRIQEGVKQNPELEIEFALTGRKLQDENCRRQSNREWGMG